MSDDGLPRRSIWQLRPKVAKGQEGAMAYAPQRDLAYLFPAAMREAFRSLDRVNWMDYFAPWLAAASVTESDFAEGVKRFLTAHTMFVGDPAIVSPDDAYEKAGFFDVPAPVRIIIFERIGEVVAAGFFIALRDVTYKGEESPQVSDIGAYMAAGQELIRRLHGTAPRESSELEEENARLRYLLDNCRKTLGRQIELTAAEQAALRVAVKRVVGIVSEAATAHRQTADLMDAAIRSREDYEGQLYRLRWRGLAGRLVAWWRGEP